MRILVASPSPYRILPGLHGHNDEIIMTNDAPASWPKADWAILYGYRFLIGEPTLWEYGNRIINIHISKLPYNRGADPNFWSWFDDTPKGVTIHRVDKGLDTGAILAQVDVDLPIDAHTLASSYESLQTIASLHFTVVWPQIRADEIVAIPQPKNGTYHRQQDKEVYMSQLPLGWDTPVKNVYELGRAIRDGRAVECVS